MSLPELPYAWLLRSRDLVDTIRNGRAPCGLHQLARGLRLLVGRIRGGMGRDQLGFVPFGNGVHKRCVRPVVGPDSVGSCANDPRSGELPLRPRRPNSPHAGDNVQQEIDRKAAQLEALRPPFIEVLVEGSTEALDVAVHFCDSISVGLDALRRTFPA